MGELTISSRLAATPEALWRHATSPEGVNRELRPLLRMILPRDVEDLTADLPPGGRPFRSWILLAGMLPVEYDDLAFAEVERGRRFLERSELLTQRIWEHERRIDPAPPGCVLTDRVRFVPRIPWLDGVHAAVFRAVFGWRHRNLRRIFGGAPGTARL